MRRLYILAWIVLGGWCIGCTSSPNRQSVVGSGGTDLTIDGTEVGDTDTGTDGDTDTDADGDTDTDADNDADSDVDGDTDTDADGDTDTDADNDADTDADGDTDSDVDSDTDTDVDGDTDTDIDGDTDSDTDTDGDMDTNSEAASDTGSDTELDNGVATCVKACSEPKDCVALRNDATHDENNYACEGGSCVYLGCQSDAECEEINPGFGYICTAAGCVTPCTEPAECAILEYPTYDENNFECRDGGCFYLGCISDSECALELGNAYNCQDPLQKGEGACGLRCSGDNVDNCVKSTESALDADNYICEDEKCVYTGCKQGECGDGYVCI